jgi:hypothetical protein
VSRCMSPLDQRQSSAVRCHSRPRHKHSGAGYSGNPAALPRKILDPRLPPARGQASRGRHSSSLRTIFAKLPSIVAKFRSSRRRISARGTRRRPRLQAP